MRPCGRLSGGALREARQRYSANEDREGSDLRDISGLRRLTYWNCRAGISSRCLLRYPEEVHDPKICHWTVSAARQPVTQVTIVNTREGGGGALVLESREGRGTQAEEDAGKCDCGSFRCDFGSRGDVRSPSESPW